MTHDPAYDRAAKLRSLANAQTYAEYFPLFCEIEQELNSYSTQGLGEDKSAAWAEFERIVRVVAPALRKQEYDSIRVYSLDELCATAISKQRSAA